METEPLIDLINRDVAWDDVVKTIELGGNPNGKRCRARSYDECGETQYVTVLELPLVKFAESAVKVAIASKARGS